MRKVTSQAALALRYGHSFKVGNTRVIKGEFNELYLQLHRNTIAEYFPEISTLKLYDAGWQTRTTKERLNGVLETFGLPYRLSQWKGQWWIDGPHGAITWAGDAEFSLPGEATT